LDFLNVEKVVENKKKKIFQKNKEKKVLTKEYDIW